MDSVYISPTPSLSYTRPSTPMFVHRFLIAPMFDLHDIDTQYPYADWCAVISGFDAEAAIAFQSIGLKKNESTGTWVIQVDTENQLISNPDAYVDVLFITRHHWCGDNIPVNHPD